MYTDTIVTESLCNRYAEITNSIEGQKTIPFIHRIEPGSTDFGKKSLSYISHRITTNSAKVMSPTSARVFTHTTLSLVLPKLVSTIKPSLRPQVPRRHTIAL